MSIGDAATAALAVGTRSQHAERLLADLLAVDPGTRRLFIADAQLDEMTHLLRASQDILGTPYGLWADDPVGFVEVVLGETMWSKQREVMAALPGHKRIAVPAGFGLGKTHLAARAVTWFCCVYPVGTASAVTTATRMRQVQRQLWPHVRRVVARAALPGDCDMVQWKMPDRHGVDTVVAYGFTAPEHDEAAMQGIHAARLLLVVDEAGGFSRTVGGSTRNLLTGDARMLAIGNPPTDDEASWFESLVSDGFDPDRGDTVTIEIPATSSPAVSGEDAGRCRDCPPAVPAHSLSVHLVDEQWIKDAIREHGDDAPYVVAKVNAKFPKGGSARAIPATFVDVGLEAVALQRPDEEDLPDTPVSTDRHGQPYTEQPALGAFIRLGVDVAADGGDEFVIARAEGDLVRIRLSQSGAVNQNAVDVAGKVLEEIRAAEALADALGTANPVHVKVDSIGVGWGVVSTLEAWGKEGLHDAVVVRVNVAEIPDRPDDPKAMWRPKNKRAEMWLNGRNLLTPDPSGRVALRLDVDHRTAAQLRGPNYGTDASGRQYIESKKDMRSRGVNSPDRGEAVLLAVYEPRSRRKARLLA